MSASHTVTAILPDAIGHAGLLVGHGFPFISGVLCCPGVVHFVEALSALSSPHPARLRIATARTVTVIGNVRRCMMYVCRTGGSPNSSGFRGNIRIPRYQLGPKAVLSAPKVGILEHHRVEIMPGRGAIP
jgi:hypothetical protein